MEKTQRLKIDVKTLRRAAERLFDDLETEQEIDLTDRAWYWTFLAPGRYRFPTPPSNPSIGDLNDDWAELRRISDPREIGSLSESLDNLGSILSAIADELDYTI